MTKKRKSTQPLSTDELDAVAGGVTIGSVVEHVTLSEPSLTSSSPSNKPAKEKPALALTEDRFDAPPTTKSSTSPKLLGMKKKLEGARKTLQALAIRPESLETTSATHRHLNRVLFSLDELKRDRIKIESRADISPAERSMLLKNLDALATGHTQLISQLQNRKKALTLPKLFEYALKDANSDKPLAKTLSKLKLALALFKQHSISTLPQAERMALQGTLDQLQKQLLQKKTQLKANFNIGEKEKVALLQETDTLISQLKNMVILQGIGPRLRFEQSRYMADGGFGKVAKKKFEKESQREIMEAGLYDLEKDINQALETGNALSASAKAVNSEMMRQAGTKISRYGPQSLERLLNPVLRAGVELQERTRLAPHVSQTTLSADENLHLVPAHLERLATRGGVYEFDITGHSMTISADPKKHVYRFFDPNYGLYEYNNPKEFAEQVTAFVNSRYNNSKFSPYNLADGPKKPNTDTMTQHLVVNIAQGKDLDAVFQEGICAAMSAHVSRWFLEHPGYQGNIDANTLGLNEFELDFENTSRSDTPNQTFSMAFTPLTLRK